MSCHAYSRSHKSEFTSMQLCYLDSTWHSSLLALLLTYRLAWNSHRIVVALHKLTWNPTFLTVCFSRTFSLKVNNFIFIIAKFSSGLPTSSKSLKRLIGLFSIAWFNTSFGKFQLYLITAWETEKPERYHVIDHLDFWKNNHSLHRICRR